MKKTQLFFILAFQSLIGDAFSMACSDFKNSYCEKVKVVFKINYNNDPPVHESGDDVCRTRYKPPMYQNTRYVPHHPEGGSGCEYDYYFEVKNDEWVFSAKTFTPDVVVEVANCRSLDFEPSAAYTGGTGGTFVNQAYNGWVEKDPSLHKGQPYCIYCQPGAAYSPIYFGNYDAIGCVQMIDKNLREQPQQCVANQPNPNPGTPNPIYPLMGTKIQSEPVLSGRLTATFNSINQIEVQDLGFYFRRQEFRAPASFGSAWNSSLHKALTLQYSSQTDGVQGNVLAVQVGRGTGHVVSFTWSAPLQKYVPVIATTQATLVAVVGGGWHFFDAASKSLERYDAAGNLVSQHAADGSSQTYAYSVAATATAPGAGYLVQVQSDRGRTIGFEYEAVTGGGRIKRIIDEAGRAIGVAYDANGNLGTLTWPDGKQRQYLYENTTHKAALTGIVDENGTRYATYGYDAEGRAISSEHAGGVNRYAVSYPSRGPRLTLTTELDATAWTVTRTHGWVAPPAEGNAAVVSQPTGASIGQQATLRGGSPGLTTQSQPAGSGCEASTSNLSYDANGNVASQDNFNGNRTCFVNDAIRNLESARVEGLANTVACSSVISANATLPTNSRKTSTQWHPDWRLPARVAEPGKLTTSVYNGQPDPTAGNALASCAPASALLPDGKPIAVLCKQVEQATTDADGSKAFAATLQAGVTARITRWTYNARGQVLTEDGPRTDVSDVTTYVYYADTTADHTLGDLQSMTNAAGKVTQYTKYNKHGQLLQSTDANGVLTVMTYDLRQRPLSVSVGGQSTTMTYDAAGQLKQVKLPDGSFVAYTYDAAHRLIAVADRKGNRIDYQLDNAGNRIGETSKDPAGTLQRQLARSIDALGRVQQTTGR